jgi:hypothetical protein
MSNESQSNIVMNYFKIDINYLTEKIAQLEDEKKSMLEAEKERVKDALKDRSIFNNTEWYFECDFSNSEEILITLLFKNEDKEKENCALNKYLTNLFDNLRYSNNEYTEINLTDDVAIKIGTFNLVSSNFKSLAAFANENNLILYNCHLTLEYLKNRATLLQTDFDTCNKLINSIEEFCK